MLGARTLIPYSLSAGRIFTPMPEDSSYIFHGGYNYILIRGTDSGRDIVLGRSGWARTPIPTPIGLVHQGYWYAVNNIIPHVLDNMAIGAPLVFCGYSRGGALSAILCAMAYIHGFETKAFAVGSPACMEPGAHQKRCEWWVSRDDELAYPAFGAPFERDGTVHEFNGPRHLPAVGYMPYL